MLAGHVTHRFSVGPFNNEFMLEHHQVSLPRLEAHVIFQLSTEF